MCTLTKLNKLNTFAKTLAYICSRKTVDVYVNGSLTFKELPVDGVLYELNCASVYIDIVSIELR